MPSVADQVLRISRRETSPSYLSRAELVEYADGADRHLYVFDAERSDSVVELAGAAELDATDAAVRGFALTGRYDRDAYPHVVSVPVEEILARTPLTEDDFPLSQFKVVAVDAEHAGKGIGSALTATALAPLFEDPPVTAMIWERENGANVALAERYANNRLVTFEDYFGPDWECPDCGFDSRCECAVTMYGWFADERRKLAAE